MGGFVFSKNNFCLQYCHEKRFLLLKLYWKMILTFKIVLENDSYLKNCPEKLLLPWKNDFHREKKNLILSNIFHQNETWIDFLYDSHDSYTKIQIFRHWPMQICRIIFNNNSHIFWKKRKQKKKKLQKTVELIVPKDVRSLCIKVCKRTRIKKWNLRVGDTNVINI